MSPTSMSAGGVGGDLGAAAETVGEDVQGSFGSPHHVAEWSISLITEAIVLLMDRPAKPGCGGSWGETPCRGHGRGGRPGAGAWLSALDDWA
jgi:hypothetical protein